MASANKLGATKNRLGKIGSRRVKAVFRRLRKYVKVERKSPPLAHASLQRGV
jgi:hypothetical protein